MHRRSRSTSLPQAESRIRAITRPGPGDPPSAASSSVSPSAPGPSEDPRREVRVPIPPPPYAGEPPPPEPPPGPPPAPEARYDDDGALAYPPSTADPPEAVPPSFTSYDEGRPGPLERIRNLVSGDELDPGRPGLRMLLVVGVVAVLVGGWYWWHARPREAPLPAPSPVRPAAARPQPLPATPGPSPSATGVVVDVAGKVRHPGVVHLPSGSRVIDAVDAAGGAKPGAPTGGLNLARVLVDGEQIVVGASAAPTPVPPSGATPGASSGATVSLNTASEEQLDTLPGVGPVLAKRILDYRTQHGGFRTIDELRDVTGIGPKRFADLKPEVTL